MKNLFTLYMVLLFGNAFAADYMEQQTVNSTIYSDQQIGLFLNDLKALPTAILLREIDERSNTPRKVFLEFLGKRRGAFPFVGEKDYCENELRAHATLYEEKLSDYAKLRRHAKIRTEPKLSEDAKLYEDSYFRMNTIDALSYLWDDCSNYIEIYDSKLKNNDAKEVRTPRSNVGGCDGTVNIITKLAGFFEKHHVFLSSLYTTATWGNPSPDFKNLINGLSDLRTKWINEGVYWRNRMAGDGLLGLSVKNLLESAASTQDPIERLQRYVDAAKIAAQDGCSQFLKELNDRIAATFDENISKAKAVKEQLSHN